ncbi:MAG: DUF2470 domain-containing protein [Pseudomonadota bacterium]
MISENYKLQGLQDRQVEIAKSILRTECRGTFRYIDADTSEIQISSMQFVSDVDGAILITLPASFPVRQIASRSQSVTLITGTANFLTLTGTLEKLEGTHIGLAAGRYIGRHGVLPENSDLIRFVPVEIALTTLGDTRQIPIEDLLAKIDENFWLAERRSVDHMNDDHLDAIKLYAEVLLNERSGHWRMASLDMDGMDLVHEDRFARLWFNPPLKGPEEIKSRLVELVKEARG